MPIIFCPHCQARVLVDKHIGDFVHKCADNPDTSDSLKQDDVVVVGNWEDYDGSGTKAPQAVLNQGAANELQGTRAAIEFGEDEEETTSRGNRVSTHRQRSHLEYINLEKND